MRHATNFILESPVIGAIPASPVARHVALMRQDWRDRFAEYEHAEYADISGLSEVDQDAAFDRAGEALDALSATRAPDLATLADKMRLMHKLGTVLAEGYFENLIEDVDALSKRTVTVPTAADIRSGLRALIKRGLAKIEPWYQWRQRDIFRIDAHERDFSDESTGRAFQFEIQWLGVHFAFELGRTPRKHTPAEIAAERQRIAARAAARAAAEAEG